MSGHSRIVLAADSWQDYTLLDTGDGKKLEQVGPHRLVRPEARALWSPASPTQWQGAVAEFTGPDEERRGAWQVRGAIPESWGLSYGTAKFTARLTSFRHLGFFPEQAPLWDWMVDKVQNTKYKIRVLNLFGYTGIASVLLAAAGADVTHVDASKQSTTWARENQTLSNLADVSIRWIVDDALAFVKREARRGNRYDAIIMDPPKFGRGPKGEVWKAEEALAELFAASRAIVSDRALFGVVTIYTIPLPAEPLSYAVTDLFAPPGARVECGELANIERTRGRLIPTATFARWSV